MPIDGSTENANELKLQWKKLNETAMVPTCYVYDIERALSFWKIWHVIGACREY